MPVGNRKPTALKIIHGKRGHVPLPKDEPKPERGADMPDFLSPKAARHWPIVADQLDKAGVLTKMDALALALYCESFVTWCEANTKLEKEGMVLLTKQGYPVQSPWFAISRTAHDQMYRLLVQFGMTPSARGGVKSHKGDEEAKNNPFKSLRGKGGSSR